MLRDKTWFLTLIPLFEKNGFRVPDQNQRGMGFPNCPDFKIHVYKPTCIPYKRCAIYLARLMWQVPDGTSVESWTQPAPIDISSGTCSSDDELRVKRVLAGWGAPSPPKSPAPGPGYLDVGSRRWSSTSCCCGGSGLAGWSGSAHHDGCMSWSRRGLDGTQLLQRRRWWRFAGGCWLADNHPSKTVDNTIGFRLRYPVGNLVTASVTSIVKLYDESGWFIGHLAGLPFPYFPCQSAI